MKANTQDVDTNGGGGPNAALTPIKSNRRFWQQPARRTAWSILFFSVVSAALWSPLAVAEPLPSQNVDNFKTLSTTVARDQTVSKTTHETVADTSTALKHHVVTYPTKAADDRLLSNTDSRFPAISKPAPLPSFTINDVLEKRIAVDRYAIPTVSGRVEPFGHALQLAPEGLLWKKWQKVVSDIRAEEPILMRCLADSIQCSPAAAHFGSIVNETRKLRGLAKLELVNRRVNAAIRYSDDVVHWGMPDVWSAPLDTSNKGSFDTGIGDCEDYAIAKYVALREADVPAQDLQLLLVRDKSVNVDHAVLAARNNGRWLILDNRWDRLIEDTETKQSTPLFAVDEQGVKQFAVHRDAKLKLLSSLY
jgi:predicted transglutaminase-like cysteine proteinase